MNDSHDGAAAGTTTPELDELIERTERLQREAAALRARHRSISQRLDAAAADPASSDSVPARPADAATTVRLVATDMALTGADRAMVDAHLRENLGSEQHDDVLDEVFGSQAGSGRRRRRFSRRA